MDAICFTPKIVYPCADNLINLHLIQDNLIWRKKEIENSWNNNDILGVQTAEDMFRRDSLSIIN